jgi:hypothetical protein
MTVAFFMNAFALGLSCVMLLGWYPEFSAAGETTLPRFIICNQLGIPVSIGFITFLCFCASFPRCYHRLRVRFPFEHLKVLSGIRQPVFRRAVVSCFSMVISMGVSMVGLSKIIKYGYG